jgi:putative endonuclease
MSRHYVYLVRCADGTLYTGYTTDVARRVFVHNSGKGAKYTRSRLPVELVAQWEYPSRGEALAAEYRIRRMRPAAKLALRPEEAP